MTAGEVLDARLAEIAAEQVRLQAQHDALAEGVDRLRAETLRAYVDVVVRLAALEADVEEPPPPPTPEHPFRLGAGVTRLSGQTDVQAMAAFEAQIGTGIQVARRFQPGRRLFTEVAAFMADVGRRDRIVSIKGEPTQAQIAEFIDSIPVDGFKTTVVVHHEPENDGGSHTPAWFKAQQAALLAATTEAARDDVDCGIVLMSYLERDGNDSTSSADWFPDDPTGFVMLLDPYDGENDPREFADRVGPTLELWRAAGGTRWGIGETSTKRTGADGARWIRDAGAWAKAEGCEAFCWFHSHHGSRGPWWLPEGEMSAAFAALTDD